jgi:hypothetical protein
MKLMRRAAGHVLLGHRRSEYVLKELEVDPV